jgi:hypothetical protein
MGDSTIHRAIPLRARLDWRFATFALRTLRGPRSAYILSSPTVPKNTKPTYKVGFAAALKRGNWTASGLCRQTTI